MSAVRARWERLDRPERIALAGLAVLLAGGIALRLLAMLAYRPALIGYYDTPVYVEGARGELFWDPLRAAGYSLFLRMAHALNDSLSFTTIVQHGLGVASALLLYAAVRRGGGPPWLGLVPAAVVLLGGDQVVFEHALLSESSFTFLVAAALWLALSSRDASPWNLPAATGALLGLAACVRLAGLTLIPLVVLWLALVPAARRRDRLARAAVAAAGSAAVLAGYLVAAHAQTDRWSFTRHGAYNFYGRVATFADCDEFDPPAGTEAMCEDTPPHSRGSPQYYASQGPAVVVFGEPQQGRVLEGGPEKIARFSRRAALAQPLDWLDASARDFARYVLPNRFGRPFNTASTREYRAALDDAARTHSALGPISSYWSTAGVRRDASLYPVLTGYQDRTHVEGVPMALLLLLAALGPALCRGRERQAALLFGGIGVALLAVPVVTLNYDGRLGVPAYGPLAAGAAFGALGLGRAVRARLPSSAA
ncbi:MAG TPA: hypothetical protein VF712_16465 [Thermoleophilaceae bacterium]